MTLNDAPLKIDIPLVDLAAQHHEVAAEVQAGWDRVLACTGFIGGPAVADFEAELGTWWGRRHVIGVANGTDALELMLRASGIGPGRRGHRAGQLVHRHRVVGRAGRRPAGVRRRRPDLPPDRPGPGGRPPHPPHPGGRSPCTCSGRWRPWRPSRTCWRAPRPCCSRTPPRPRAPFGTAIPPAPSAWPPPPASTRARTWAPTATAAPCSPTARSWPGGCGSLGNHGAGSKYDHDELGFNSRLDALQAVVLSRQAGPPGRLERGAPPGGRALPRAARPTSPTSGSRR